MLVSDWAFRKSPAAGRSYGNQVKERGKEHVLGPSGIHAGMAPVQGTQEIMWDWQKEDPATVA
eukprot:7935686-Pyramimonas_sp.AAC.1